MINTSMGYVFECKKDINNMFGVRESFSISGYKDRRKVTAIFGIDGNFNIMSPAFCTANDGFKPLFAELFNSRSTESVEMFLKSNRATYSVLPYVNLICMVNGRINTETFEFEKSSVTFYVPRAMVRIDTETFAKERVLEDHGVVCEKAASDSKELNTFFVESTVLTMIERKIANTIARNVSSKLHFISSRLM